MKKVLHGMFVGLIALLLAACGNAQANHQLTVQEVYERAKEASSNLEQVRTTVVYEDFWKTTVPDERMSVKYEMTSDATLQPDRFSQRVLVNPLGEKSWQADIYKVNDRLFMKKDGKADLEEIATGSMTELFGTMVAAVNPTLDFTIFEPYRDDFELEKIDYGYRLKLTLSREQYKEFRKLMLDEVTDEALAEIEDEYPLINKFEMEISIDALTYFVSNFKMTLDTTAYSTTKIDGNSHRVKQKMNAGYSRFNDVETVNIPAVVQEAATQ